MIFRKNKRKAWLEKYDYYSNQRILRLQKSRQPLYNMIQRVANEVIDDFVFNYHTDLSDKTVDKSKPDYYRNRILALNKADIGKAFARILDKTSLRKDTVNKIMANITAGKVAVIMTDAEVLRVQKNIVWADKVLSNAELQVDTYKRLVEKMKPTSSRRLMLEKSLQEETIPKEANAGQYRELSGVARGLEKYKTNSLDLEARNMENSQAIRDGGEMIHTSKIWIWSRLEHTRHSQMDEQTVNLNGKFEVLNEVTGDLDFLLFPGDIDNDDHNCSNICNCQCSVAYE